VTEQEWLAHDDPAPMLQFVAGRTSERKLRLFLCACCARVLDGAWRLGDGSDAGRVVCWRSLEGAVRTVERFADGLCGADALAAARRAAEDAVYVPAYINYAGESGLDYEASAVSEAAAARLTPAGVVATCRQALVTLRSYRLGDRVRVAHAFADPLAEHQREAVSWLRDVVGNPFRPAAVDPGWLRDGDVARVAESVYAKGSFDELGILADALEDAGCADGDLLGHLRGPGPHVRGCWALDLFIEAPRRFALAAASSAREEAIQLPPPDQPRPGDWRCAGCNAYNFARRDVCYRCERARPAPRLREGDWLCPACDAHNFARRQSCHQCKGARPS
jgi:hypothetical protein